MNYIVWIQLEGFYVRALGLQGAAVVHDSAQVLDATAEAKAMGVSVGMGLAEARAALDGRGTWVIPTPQRVVEAQLQWLETVSVYSDRVEPLTPDSAFVDLSSHPRPTEIARRLVRAVEKVSRGKVRSGAARTRWLAEHAGQVGDPSRLALLLPELFLADHPIYVLREVPAVHLERLLALGYRRVGDLQELSLETLQKLFGAEAYAIYAAARGQGPSHVRADFPQAAASTEMRFEAPPQDLESLQQAMKELSRVLGDQLVARHRAGHVLEALLEFEDGGMRVLRRRFTRPMQHPTSVWAAAKLLLARTPEQPIAALRLRATGLEYSKPVQLGLDGMQSRGERARQAARVVHGLRETFGDQSVVLASQRPTDRRKQVLSAWHDAYGWR